MMRLRVASGFLMGGGGKRCLHQEIRKKVVKTIQIPKIYSINLINFCSFLKKLKEKHSAKKLALEYFDFYYGATFKDEWHSMRLAMLTGQKYMAVVNNYSDDLAATLASLQKQTALNIFEYLRKKNENENRLEEESVRQQQLAIPPELKVYAFDTGETMRFETPSREFNDPESKTSKDTMLWVVLR